MTASIVQLIVPIIAIVLSIVFLNELLLSNFYFYCYYTFRNFYSFLYKKRKLNSYKNIKLMEYKIVI